MARDVTCVTKLDSNYTMSRYSQCQYTGAYAPRIIRSRKEATMAKTQERDKALAWIARQLRWERTLAHLRTGEVVLDQRKAA